MSRDFHWRGGDVLKEKEYLTAEYKQALSDYRKMSMIKENLEKEVNQASQELTETMGYTDALSTFIDGTQNSQKEQNLKIKLDRLEQKIAKKHDKLEELAECQNPAAVSSLVKENGFLLVESQRGSKTVENNKLQIEATKRQLAACTISDQYQYSLHIENLITRENKRKNALSKRVRQLKGVYDSSKKYTVSNSEYAQKLRDALTDSNELKTEMKDSSFNYRCEVEDHNTHIKSLINQIDELNQRMEELELNDYLVDVDDLKKRFPSKTAYKPKDEEIQQRRKEKEERHRQLFEEDRDKRINEEEREKREKKERDKKRREEIEQAEKKREEERKKDLAKYHERKRQEEENRKKSLSNSLKKKPESAQNKSSGKTTSISKPMKTAMVKHEFQDDETTHVGIGEDDDDNNFDDDNDNQNKSSRDEEVVDNIDEPADDVEEPDDNVEDNANAGVEETHDNVEEVHDQNDDDFEAND